MDKPKSKPNPWAKVNEKLSLLEIRVLELTEERSSLEQRLEMAKEANRDLLDRLHSTIDNQTIEKNKHDLQFLFSEAAVSALINTMEETLHSFVDSSTAQDRRIKRLLKRIDILETPILGAD
jgi:translation initiation factor 2 beta subunit (eIF-2beta)/eIF-5